VSAMKVSPSTMRSAVPDVHSPLSVTMRLEISLEPS
jgi:hypothetical protein